MTSQWWRHAACRTEPKSTFFQLTNNGGDRVSDGPWFDQARTICASCPVRSACLADALATECTPRIGFRAGLTAGQRDNLTGVDRYTCNWCSAPVAGRRLYCSQGCRDDARSHRHTNRDAVA